MLEAKIEKIRFEHLGCRSERMPWPSDIGRPTHRWVPIGMPRLRPELADTIFYLYRRNPKTGEIEGPCGTGSIAAKKSSIELELHLYAVSNYHLTHSLGASIIRLNTKDGKFRLLEYDPSDWQFIKNGDDLSMIDITDDLNVETDQFAVNGEWMFLTDTIVGNYEISFGEDIFMFGLLADHYGGKRNRPVVLFGNVSRTADDDAPVEQPHGMVRPSHLGDMRSRTGFSGSAVFLYRIPEMDLTHQMISGEFIDLVGFVNRRTLTKRKEWFLGLFGVHCGQFPEAAEVRKSPQAERLGDPIAEGDKLYIPSGRTTIVPASRIIDLWNLEVFLMAREKRETKRRGETENRPRPEGVVPTSDANPKHREDFNSLVGEAARKREQED